MKRTLWGLPIFILALATLGADCEGNVVKDPTFRDWCGNALCSWHTDFGQIQAVPTWNADDLGVSFLDGPQGTEISQVTDEDQATCLLFTSVGNIDASAQMTVSVDFDNDGTVDFSAPIGAARWKSVQMEITAPSAYQGITFYVKKAGTGTAVLAEMRITSSTGCSAPPPSLHDLRLGEACSGANQCAAGLVCGRGADGGPELCSQCSPQSPCPGGVPCQRASEFLPFQCAPGAALGQPGVPCLANGDCASGVCVGASFRGLESDAASCGAVAALPGDAGDCFVLSALGGACQ